MRRLLTALVAAVPLTAAAGGFTELRSHQVLGWTADSAFFVHRYTEVYDDAGGRTTVTLHSHSDGTSRNLIVEELEPPDEDGAALRVVPGEDAKELAAWLAAHPLAPNLGRASPGGKLSAEISGPGKWEGVFFVLPKGKPGKRVLSVKRDGLIAPAQVVNDAAGKLTPSWSPDGKRIAWEVEVQTMGGIAVSVLFGPIGGPRVELVGYDPDSKAMPRARAAIAGVGLVLTGSRMPEKLGRAASVVYFAKGFETDAKRLAGAVPGGATVEPLSWKADAELVLALGKSAEK